MSEEAELLSPRMTVLSMINGMIGGFILILPVLALETGYISTLIVIIITGAFSYYSSYICISHIGKEQDLDSAVYKHFGKSAKMRMFYDLCIWSSLLLIDFLYF
jgi:amino acid permease